MTKTIIIDPGHGIQRRWLDKGVIYKNIYEADVVLDYALTCKYVLSDKFSVVLTRTGELGAKLTERTKIKGDLFLSLHLNSVNTYGLVYYKSLGMRKYVNYSKALGDILQQKLHLKFLKPSTTSRFNRLYIDDFPKTAVLIEIDAINKVVNTKEERLKFANTILSVLSENTALL